MNITELSTNVNHGVHQSTFNKKWDIPDGEEGDENALSMRTVTLSGGERALLVSYALGSGDLLRIYLANCEKVTKMFEEPYRDFFWPVTFNQDDQPRFLIFLADNLTEFDNKLMVKQWEWNGEIFQVGKTVSYHEFVNRFTEENRRPE